MAPLSAVLLAALLGWGAPPAAADETDVAIQRYLVNLTLGDTLDDIQNVYPPAQEWPATTVRRKHVKRLRVERDAVKGMPEGVQTMFLGLKWGRLVEIELVYDPAYTKGKSAEEMARDFAVVYGSPKKSGGKFWWTDGSTVLRVFYAEVPGESGPGVELHTCLQVMEASLFHR